ncbi:MAG: cardiolipin synthase [Roseburia sp.]|nr:cardiolipin synthase [Roseburia sp.]MCM1420071.1 cardiolipin synthase [Bacteroides sp.]
MKLFVLFFFLTTSSASVSFAQDSKEQSDSVFARHLIDKGIELTDSNSVSLLKSGHDKFVDLFETVRNAKKFVHLEYFNFRNDSIANLLFEILAEKAKEGVEIRAMYDAFGNWSNNKPILREHHDSISERGIRLVKFDPLTFPWINHIIPRDHRKIVVIDGEVAYTGGMNVADYYIEGIEGIGAWRDMHARIEGAAVNELHRIFAQMWEKATGEHLEEAKYFPLPKTTGNKRVAVVDRSPKVSNEAIRDLYVNMLNSARHSVRLVNPYFVPTHKVRKALKDAIDRGVDVEIMLSAKSDIPLTPEASHYVGNNLAKRGAKVYLFKGGFHHTKIMMVDGLYCTVGSANLDSRSLRCDYEVNTVIFSQETTNELIEMFEQDKKTSDLVKRGYWSTRSPWKRFVGWFGNLLTPLL